VTADNPAPRVDIEALALEAAAFLERAPAGEGIGAKLSRLLLGFLPQAAAGTSPTVTRSSPRDSPIAGDADLPTHL
jgi:hypothetical protein